MGLASTGISIEQLQADVHYVVDELIADENLWDYVPALSLLSIAKIVSTLAYRWRKGEVSKQDFIRMTAKFTGLQAAKLLLLVGALSVPGLNVVVGAALVAKFCFSVQRAYQ